MMELSLPEWELHRGMIEDVYVLEYDNPESLSFIETHKDELAGIFGRTECKAVIPIYSLVLFYENSAE